MFFKLENEIFDPNNSIDNEKIYFNFHKNRFKRFDNFLNNITINKPHIKKVLDIGSHYLHNSVLLSLRDFNVDSMDVSEFWNLDFVKNRSKKYDLNPIIENKLSELIVTKLSPISKEIQKLLSDKNYIDQILEDGAIKAQDISSKKVKKIKEIVGF